MRLQRALGPHDAALDRCPVSPGDDGLQLAGLLQVAGFDELHEPDARLGRDVGEAADHARTAAQHRLQGEIGRAAHAHKTRARFGGGGRARRRDYPVQFARVAAGEFAADDVGVLGELDDGVRAEVNARRGGGKVVDQNRDRGGRGHVQEEVHDGVFGVEAAVVRGRENEGVVAARGCRIVAELDCFARGLRAAADDDGHVPVASIVEGLAGGAGDQVALLVGHVDGLTIGSLSGNALDSRDGKADGMIGDGFQVQVFGLNVKEAGGRNVDSWHQRSPNADIVRINGTGVKVVVVVA